MKVIWLDVDGVLLDYTTPFLKYSDLHTMGITYDNLFDYDLSKLFFNSESCADMMLRFALSEEFGNLRAIARQIDLETLKNLGYSLRVITQLPAPAAAKIARIRNLTRNFGPIFDEVVFTVPGQCKIQEVVLRSNVGDEVILVEDNPKLLVRANELMKGWSYMPRPDTGYNIEIFGVQHPYNETAVADLNYLRVGDDFQQVARWIVEDSVK